MVIICDRHDVLSHRVLNNIYSFLSSLNKVVICYDVSKLTDLVRLWKLKQIEPTCVIFQDPLVLVVFLLLKPSSRSNLIYFCLEMWGYDVPNNSLLRIFRNTIFRLSNRLALSISCTVVFSNYLRRRFYIDKYCNLKEKSFVFENYYLGREIPIRTPKHSEDFRSKLNHIRMNHKVITCYAGGIQPGRNILMIASVFDKMSSESCFVVAGEDRIGIRWSKFKNGNVYYFGPLSDSELNELYAITKWGFMDYDNVLLNTRYCAPLKLYEYLAHDIGVISNRNYAMLEKQDLIDFFYEDEKELELIIRRLPTVPSIRKDNREHDFSKKFRELLIAILAQKNGNCDS